jgi:hypothetical protein
LVGCLLIHFEARAENNSRLITGVKI